MPLVILRRPLPLCVSAPRSTGMAVKGDPVVKYYCTN